jgi:hypothetical protein
MNEEITELAGEALAVAPLVAVPEEDVPAEPPVVALAVPAAVAFRMLCKAELKADVTLLGAPELPPRLSSSKLSPDAVTSVDSSAAVEPTLDAPLVAAVLVPLLPAVEPAVEVAPDACGADAVLGGLRRLVRVDVGMLLTLPIDITDFRLTVSPACRPEAPRLEGRPRRGRAFRNRDTGAPTCLPARSPAPRTQAL